MGCSSNTIFSLVDGMKANGVLLSIARGGTLPVTCGNCCIERIINSDAAIESKLRLDSKLHVGIG